VNHGYLILHDPDPPRLLGPGRYWIGRAPRCELRFDAPGLSRFHACIEVLPGRGVVIRDLGSTNGTWVDGERVLMVALDSAARLRVGDVELILRPATGEDDGLWAGAAAAGGI
jgi:pSer/pThr/pTyr-binding forkhead associated (FHA) protein